MAVLQANANTYTHLGLRKAGEHPFLGLAPETRVVYYPDEGAFSLKLSTITVESSHQADLHLAFMRQHLKSS
jgi:hypothetical protein